MICIIDCNFLIESYDIVIVNVNKNCVFVIYIELYCEVIILYKKNFDIC